MFGRHTRHKQTRTNHRRFGIGIPHNTRSDCIHHRQAKTSFRLPDRLINEFRAKTRTFEQHKVTFRSFIFIFKQSLYLPFCTEFVYYVSYEGPHTGFENFMKKINFFPNKVFISKFIDYKFLKTFETLKKGFGN
jgi:hypothetical protein